MSSRGAPIVVAVSLAACDPPQQLHLPFPPATPGGSLIIGVNVVDEPDLFAFSATPGERHMDVELGGLQTGQRVFALVFDRPLESLGLVAGQIATSAGGVQLPSSASSYSLAVDGDLATWQLSPPPEVVAQIRVAVQADGCAPRFTVSDPVEIPARTKFGFSLPEGALLTQTDGHLYHFDASGVAPLGPMPVVATAARQADDGGVWLGGLGGELWHARASAEGLVEVALVAETTTSAISSVAVGRTPDGQTEVFLLAYRGTLFRWLAPNLERIADGLTDYRELAWIGPGEIMLYRARQTKVMHVGPSGRTEGLVPAIGGVIGIGRHLDGAVVALGFDGEVFRRDASGWSQIGSEHAAVNAYALSPLGRSAIYMLASGELAELHPTAGFCPRQMTLPLTLEHIIVPTGQALVIAGVPSSDPDHSLAVHLAPPENTD